MRSMMLRLCVAITTVVPTATAIAGPVVDDHGTVPARRATVVCFQRAENATYKAAVSLTEDRVESFDQVPGVQSNFTVDEFVECDQLLRTNPELLAALAKRGIDDIDLVFFDTWTYGDAVARWTALGADLIEFDPWPNEARTIGISSSGMPGPKSLMVTSMPGSDPAPLRAIDTTTSPPD